MDLETEKMMKHFTKEVGKSTDVAVYIRCVYQDIVSSLEEVSTFK